MHPDSTPGLPLTHPLGQRLGFRGAQANVWGEASVTPSLLIQAMGNNGPKAGHKTAVCVFSNSQFNVFSNKTKGRNTWCFFSKQALVLKINQHGVGLCLWWFPLWTVERRGGDRRQQGDAAAPCFCFCSMEPEFREATGSGCPPATRSPGAVQEATCQLGPDWAYDSVPRLPLEAHHMFLIRYFYHLHGLCV